MFRRGGNAIDAGVAAGLAAAVAMVDRTSFGGVAPIILYDAKTQQTFVIDGLGHWPAAADMGWFAGRQGVVERGIRSAVIPAAPAAWLTALERFGSLTVSDVLEPAFELASNGSPVSTRVARGLEAYATQLSEITPEYRETFFPGGRALGVGERMVQPDLAGLLKRLMDQDSLARRTGSSRGEAIRRVYDYFYRGPVAEMISRYYQSHGGWLRDSDLASYEPSVEAPQRGSYRGLDIETCGFWCQGPVLIEVLNIIEALRLTEAVDFGSADYFHLLLQAIDLSFADREAYYGDPRWVAVPASRLLSKSFAEERVRMVTHEAVRPAIPSPGEIFESDELMRKKTKARASLLQTDGPPLTDTTYVAAADEAGNLFSATPSDSLFWTPIIPGLGFSCSGRGLQSRVNPQHPAAGGPGRRPRLTPSPALIGRRGRPFAAIGCPGEDAQQQGLAQFILAHFDYGLNVQEAIERPRVASTNFLGSFSPHASSAGGAFAEARIGESTIDALRALGHRVEVVSDWSPKVACIHAIVRDDATNFLVAGADPRSEGAAIAW